MRQQGTMMLKFFRYFAEQEYRRAARPAVFALFHPRIPT
jgi:hypothetical protein